MIRRWLLLLIVCAYAQNSHAQFLDSLSARVGLTATLASKDYQPLWIESNRFASIADRKCDLSTHLRFSNSHRFGRSSQNALPDSSAAAPAFYLRYALDVYNINEFKKYVIQEGYVKAGYSNLEFRAGRFKEIIGEVDPDLSCGSFSISGNALPFTKLSLALTQYIDFPFTNGWLQFKGSFSHGWMGNNRYMKDAFLHEKTIYVRAGRKRFHVFGGIAHFAEWGGKRGSMTLDRSLKGYLNVLLVKEADDGSVGVGYLPNRPGDHRGNLELGFDWEDDKVVIHAYNQTPFDGGLNIDMRNIDRLVGFTLTPKYKSSGLLKVVGEFIHTTQMNDFYPISERENYYNNGYYKTGWEYENRIVGTPLFVNRKRGTHFLDGITPYDWSRPDSAISGNDNIILNRIVGGHAGMLYGFGKHLFSKTMLTFIRYNGYKNLVPLNIQKNQWYSLEELTYTASGSSLSLKAAVAVDWGKLTENSGILLGIQWTFKHFGSYPHQDSSK